jgi:hypothetical protein
MGESAGIMFQDGVAVVTSDTAAGMSALTYFRGAGYGILPLDDALPIDELLQRGNESPEEEAARLEREIESLKARDSLEAKRQERDDLYRKVYGDDAADAREQATTATPSMLTGIAPIVPTVDDPVAPVEGQGEQGEGAESELLAPPANNASVADWRAWAVQSGRATEDEVSSRSRTELQNTLGADYDRDREEQLKGGASE